MRKYYKKILGVIASVIVVLFVVLWLKQEWDDTVVEDEIKYSIELADLKQGEEYQFGEVP